MTPDGSLREPKRARSTARSVHNLPIDLLFYIDQMLDKYKNANGPLTRRFLLKLLEHIIDVFQNYLFRDKKHEIVRRKLYLHVINNFEIFERKLPSILNKLQKKGLEAAAKPRQVLTKSDKDFVFNRERFISDLKLSNKNKFKEDSQSQVRFKQVDEELRVYKHSCNRVSIQVFRISDFFFSLLQRSFDQLFAKMFETSKRLSEKEKTLLSAVQDEHKTALIENERYLELDAEKILLRMMSLCEKPIESISVFFRIRLKKYIFDFFVKNLLKCLLIDLHNYYLADEYDLVDKSFYKVHRDHKRIAKIVGGFENHEFFSTSLRVMDQMHRISKARQDSILDELIALKSMQPRRIRQPDLVLLLRVNPSLRRREHLKNSVKEQLKTRLEKMRSKLYSTFHKTLKALIRFIILLRGRKSYYKKKSEFLTISQVEKTGFKNGLKVGVTADLAQPGVRHGQHRLLGVADQHLESDQPQEVRGLLRQAQKREPLLPQPGQKRLRLRRQNHRNRLPQVRRRQQLDLVRRAD